ncbi:tetratricopeptide repeat protein, partial [Desulfobulbus sp. TB]|nr:tetratricopeptide repeat protein [Desulfobulbus sp. TB]
TDPQAVLDALEQQEQRRVEVEFLRPATLTKLEERLRDEDLPAVDIIHFDGHGVFDRSGKMGREAAKTHIPQYMKELLKELIIKAESKGETAATPGHTGYLLFEDDQGKKALVEARILGELFHRQRVGLVVLSACQSAAMDEEDAMSSVAAWLTHAGIPSVLAMTHSVLVATVELLFARFYSSLFRGDPVGKALDDSRAALFYDPKRGERLRGVGGNQSVTLELHDWFLPALYQTGPNRPLLSRKEGSQVPAPDQKHNLPKMQESGFFGRTRELWRIERAFTVQGTRRFSVTGFGGQGKTYLALEAGYWLLRTGLFQRVCFVSFAGFQGVDPKGVAISTLATVLDESLPDAEAAEQALKRIPTLLILDNLETLADGAGLHELLTAATRWSEAGQSRVLLTSRQPDFNHPDYPIAGSFRHQCLPLEGLGIQDALDWFGELMRLPPEPKFGMPERIALIDLFHKVGFHPLSIGLLAQQLKERRPAELGERLEALLEEQPADREDRTLLASLELSLERLPERCREWLPRLGVFAGGGLEEIVKKVIEIEDFPSDWSKLQYYLSLSGLMQEERLPEINNTWLRFHPTLAPILWEQLSDEEQTELTAVHSQAYYELCEELYETDRRKPQAARAVAQVDLSNLLRAVYASLQADEAKKLGFSDHVNFFLNIFGLRQDHQTLVESAAKAGGEIGSEWWYLNRKTLGEQLYSGGKMEEAEAVFREILAGLDKAVSYERCVILQHLGRCCDAQGKLIEGEMLFRQNLNELAQLEHDKDVGRLVESSRIDLADVLTDQGRYREAKDIYQASLGIAEEQNDKRNMGVLIGQLGTLALMQSELTEAANRYQQASAIFHNLNEPASEATLLHQLSMVYEEAAEWEMAERVCREAAQLNEKYGLMDGGRIWDHLAQLCAYTGRLTEAEQWFHKALTACRVGDNRLGRALTLSNLANLLTDVPARLDEARSLAEESLTIKEALDPAATEIWMTYEILADIATKQGESSQAAAYRAKSRQAYFAFPGWRQQLWDHEELIVAVVQGSDVEAALAPYSKGWPNLKAVIQLILNGERDEAVLCESLNYEEAAIIRAILEGVIEGDR